MMNSNTVPGRPEQVSAAREFVSRTLGAGHPAAEAAVLLTSELVTNSVLHSASGGDGGKVTIVVLEVPGEAENPGLVRVEVTDDGAPGLPSPRPAGECDENGYGLRLVDMLAARWGCDGHEGGATTTWFEITP
jgi:anti-sigma regulatory factor (Ser/Thr protein kinase)